MSGSNQTCPLCLQRGHAAHGCWRLAPCPPPPYPAPRYGGKQFPHRSLPPPPAGNFPKSFGTRGGNSFLFPRRWWRLTRILMLLDSVAFWEEACQEPEEEPWGSPLRAEFYIWVLLFLYINVFIHMWSKENYMIWYGWCATASHLFNSASLHSTLVEHNYFISLIYIHIYIYMYIFSKKQKVYIYNI